MAAKTGSQKLAGVSNIDSYLGYRLTYYHGRAGWRRDCRTSTVCLRHQAPFFALQKQTDQIGNHSQRCGEEGYGPPFQISCKSGSRAWEQPWSHWGKCAGLPVLKRTLSPPRHGLLCKRYGISTHLSSINSRPLSEKMGRTEKKYPSKNSLKFIW